MHCLPVSCPDFGKMIFGLLQIASIVGWTNGLSSEKLCESKVCSGCIAGSLSCQEGGLNRLPDELSADIQYIFMIGHKFDSPILLRENFSNYPRQTAQLQRLTLRSCGIEILLPGAFFDLKSVTQLDLSQNRIRIIEPGTFAGLRLELLRLDENVDLRLSPGAFRDATIVSLSMNQCGLSTLTYDDLAPLMSNGALTNLHLSGNKLFTFDSRLEPSFLSLQSLSLENNPFTCDCRIIWLADVLQRRKVRRQTRALDAFDSLGNPAKPTELSALDGDILKPTCRAPTRLVGRLLESLTANDFYCEPPRLQNLEVDLRHTETVEPANDLEVNEKDSAPSAVVKATPLIVTLRCHIEGSPEMDISWYQRINLDTKLTSQLGFYDGLEKLTKLPGSTNPKQGIAEVALSSPSHIRDLSRSISSLPIKTRLTEQFVCFGTDPSGSNATAEVRLHWPLETNKPEFSWKTSSSQVNWHSEEAKDKQDTDRKSKEGNPISANAGLFILTEKDMNGFWLHPQYSALQMISAVVGTFLVTCILFLLGCCLLKAHHRHQDKVRTKSLLHNHLKDYQQSTPSTKLRQGQRQHQQLPITSIPVYSTAIPPSAQNSALTTLIHPDGSQSAAFANQLNYQLTQNTTALSSENSTVRGSQVPMNNGTNTISGVPAMTTYEPVTLSETVTSTTYSDSQTYDLPQFPSQIYPPLPPLPSKPGGVVLATPGPFGVNHHGTINTHLPFIFSPLTNDPKAVRFETSTLLPHMLVNTSTTNYSQNPANNAIYATSISNGPSSMSMAVAAATLSRLHNGVRAPGTPNSSVTMSNQNLAITPNHLFNMVHHRQPTMFGQPIRDVS